MVAVPAQPPAKISLAGDGHIRESTRAGEKGEPRFTHVCSGEVRLLRWRHADKTERAIGEACKQTVAIHLAGQHKDNVLLPDREVNHDVLEDVLQGGCTAVALIETRPTLLPFANIDFWELKHTRFPGIFRTIKPPED